MPVKVIKPDGTEKVYEKATSVEPDGHGDWILKDVQGNIVVTRKRPTVEEIEVL